MVGGLLPVQSSNVFFLDESCPNVLYMFLQKCSLRLNIWLTLKSTLDVSIIIVYIDISTSYMCQATSIQINRHKWPLLNLLFCWNTYTIIFSPLQLQKKISIKLDTILLVVTQFYDSDVNKAYVIRGNSVVLKCETPSYVADFLTVISWHTDNGDVYYPGNNNGI